MSRQRKSVVVVWCAGITFMLALFGAGCGAAFLEGEEPHIIHQSESHVYSQMGSASRMWFKRTVQTPYQTSNTSGVSVVEEILACNFDSSGTVMCKPVVLECGVPSTQCHLSLQDEWSNSPTTARVTPVATALDCEDACEAFVGSLNSMKGYREYMTSAREACMRKCNQPGDNSLKLCLALARTLDDYRTCLNTLKDN